MRTRNYALLAITGLLFFVAGFWYLCRTMPAPSIVQSLILNIFSGIFVSFLFLFLLLRLFRPKILISPYICKQGDKYIFKIMNHSLYDAFDAKLELFIMTPKPHTAGNLNVSIVDVPLKTSNYNIITRFRKNHEKKDPFALYALTVFTLTDLEEELKKDGVFVEFKITARHGLTGLADTFVQNFPDDKIIKQNEKFGFGTDLLTMPVNKSC